MTTIESLRMDGNAGALQALDADELSAVDGGLSNTAKVVIAVGLIGCFAFAGFGAGAFIAPFVL
jgi:lactobin A/cerein 7B family class IIb bacteriocin